MDMMQIGTIVISNLLFFLFFRLCAKKDIKNTSELATLAREENKDLHRRMCVMEERACREKGQ